MVLKKLGDELMEEYVDVLRYLGEDLGMRVVVEPHDHPVLVSSEGSRHSVAMVVTTEVRAVIVVSGDSSDSS